MSKDLRLFILRISLALTFLANSLKAFLDPSEIHHLVEHSSTFKLFYEKIPAFNQLIGLHDFIIALLLIISFKAVLKFVAVWAVIWIAVVITVFLSHQSSHENLEALEHAAPLAIAIYLSLAFFYTKKK